jgi:galactose mutarotase-like enzyme
MESVIYQNQEIKRWDVGPSTFLALPEKGARLLNWHLNMSDGSVRDVIHWPEEHHSESFENTHGGIPILFPFAGKCFDSGKEDYWRYGSTSLPMPMHGFARHSDFRIRSMDKHGFEVELEPTQEIKDFYPFDFTFTVIYHFLELSLQISLVLENEGREPIPWSAGLHPYFQIPWRKDLGLQDHRLEIHAKQVFQYDSGV